MFGLSRQNVFLLGLFGGLMSVCLMRRYASKQRLKAETVERILIYDGDCGFCQWWCDWAIQRGASKRVRFIPGYQAAAELLEASLDTEAYMDNAIYVLKVNGEVRRVALGADAINAVLDELPGVQNVPFHLLALFYEFPGIRQLENAGYRVIARNRHRMPGFTACKLPVPAGRPQDN